MNTTQKLLFLTLIFITFSCLAQPPGGGGGGIWIRNAYYGEGHTFDKCLGHQPNNGAYHHHAHPICLRAQLDDNLITVSTSRNGTTYKEKTAPWKHSPILGWAFDGYPIYGPYGYSDPLNPNSAIKRIKSSFQLRSITQRTTLPTWALAHHTGVSQTLSSTQYGPAISDTYPLGRYVEDFDVVTSAGDLDQYNGRFAATPEYPSGTYAYYTTINDDGSPAFPYIVGMQYYGSVTGNASTTAPASATTYFSNGVYSQTLTGVPQLNSWFTKNSQQNALVVGGFDPSAGAKTTWPNDAPTGATVGGGQATAAKADTQTISYTDSTVYMTANNLGSYNMGPWFIDGATNGGVFPGWPSVQNNRGQFPRTPAVAATKTNSGLGAVGLWVNGVGVYNVLDGSSYSTTAGTDAGNPVTNVLSSIHVSSASFEGGPISQGGFASAFSLFGSKLATSTVSASTSTWPTILGGSTVSIKDSAGTTHTATIGYASPSQLNYRVPEAAAAGLATVTITAGSVSIPGAINIAAAYPSIFYQFNGENTAAGYLTRGRNGQNTDEAIVQNSGGSLVPLPIDLGPATDQVYLILFGSGLGKTGTTSTTSVSIGGTSLTPSYSGAQGTWAGLDQFNVLLPRTLIGKGKVEVNFTINGKVSNTVYVTIK
jgi:uncharacterized protein (TIGR03437 family)